MDRARVLQALCRLDLGRLPADGARRRARGQRPALSREAKAGARGRQHGRSDGMKSLRFIVPLALFGILVFFLWRGLRLDPHEVPSPLIDKPAPRFALARLDDAGAKIGRDDMLGKVWLLNVWASWCVACREEHPALLAFSKTKSVPLVGLNYKDTRPEGLAWLQQLGDPYDLSIFDQNGRVDIDFGVYG